MPDRPTADQHAEKIRLKFSGPRDERRALHDALDALLALAKQGEAYEQALAHAHNLYGQEQGTEKLVERVRAQFAPIETYAPDGGKEQERRWDEAAAALSELVVRAHGHVPCEAFAAAMTALEQAEARLSQYEEPGWINAVQKVQELKAALDQAEKERDGYKSRYEQCSEEYGRVHNTDRGDWLVYKHEYDEWQQAKTDRDRLAAALELTHRISRNGDDGEYPRALDRLDAIESIARDALASHTTQEPA